MAPTPMTVADRFDRLLGRLLEELRAHYGDRLVTVAVFGSVGRGTPRDDSDVDVLVVARDLPPGRFKRVDEFLPVERAVARFETESGGRPRLLSPILKTPAEVQHGSPLFLDMVEDARILHDADGFFARYLEGLRVHLLALGARRVWLGEAWYWDLKPDLRPGEVVTWP
jgi:predicted nucleotidyltransferase